jgi:hypothetical protein
MAYFTMKRFGKNLLTLFVSLLVCVGLFEFVLWVGLLDGESQPHPVWIPPKYEELNRQINSANFRRADNNWNFFNNEDDIFSVEYPSLRYKEREAGKRRIAVLGDSVVWGYGLPFEQIWSIKLKRKLLEKYKNYEVYSWGRVAWDTVDYYLYLAELVSYLELKGSRLDLDILIISHFTNDVNFWFQKAEQLTWHDAAILKPFRRIFPLTMSFAKAHINRFIAQHFGLRAHGVELYSEENLLLYGRLLYDFARYCESKGIKLIFALTAYPDKGNAERLEKVKPLLRSAGIEHIDLFPPVHERYQDYNPRQLNANLADGHPGELLTTLYAEEVLSYLESSGHVTAEYEQADISYSADDECQLLRRLMTLSDKILFRVGAYVIRHMDSPFVGRSPNVIRGREHRKGYINRKIQQHCP